MVHYFCPYIIKVNCVRSVLVTRDLSYHWRWRRRQKKGHRNIVGRVP